ncbi:MAG: MarR family winged helix-turn-helix transcriptional regulator [Gemmatimonadales bacterium]|jgi:DNA-binding MarR family transcriptional regulator
MTTPSPDEPRHRTASSDQVLAALRRIMRAMDLHSHYLAHRHGLTGPQLVVLREIARLGEASAGQLARTVSLSQPTLTGILDRLERKGLVRRRRDSRDKRRVLVGVTRAGTRCLLAPPPLFQESFLEQFNRLQDWEQALIISSLQRVVAMMESVAERGIEPGTVIAEGLKGA